MILSQFPWSHCRKMRGPIQPCSCRAAGSSRSAYCMDRQLRAIHVACAASSRDLWLSLCGSLRPCTSPKLVQPNLRYALLRLSGGYGKRHRGVFCLVRPFASGEIAVIYGVRSMSRLSWKYIQMYRFDIALNSIDGLGADITNGKTARCIFVVLRCWWHALCCSHAFLGGRRGGGWAGQGLRGGGSLSWP